MIAIEIANMPRSKRATLLRGSIVVHHGVIH